MVCGVASSVLVAEPVSLPILTAVSVALARLSPFDGKADTSASEAILGIVFLVARDGRGKLGIAGLIGIEGTIG